MIDQKKLKELVEYHADGTLTRKIASGGVHVGKRLGCKLNSGYLTVMLDKQKYVVHRLVWLYHHGGLPTLEIDHINGVRDDNRIENLRLATKFENQQNVNKRADNKSGYLGVTWKKANRKWEAQIRVNRRNHYLGLFDTPEEAHETYLAAKAKLHTFQPVPRVFAMAANGDDEQLSA